jgi:peptidoglycan/xylan/chitin deacetylase (PgdA/CDA1 family)
MASLVEAGHEIGHHGYLHERPNQLTRDDEARVLDRGIDCIEKLTGARPKTYRCPSGAFSQHTLDLLVRAGFAYDASLHGDDVPYIIECDAGTLVELPSDYPLDDWPQYVHMKEFNMAQTIRSPRAAMEVFQAEFDAAWAYGGLWAAIWHPFVSGRLARADAMVRLIEHMQAKGQVWFATLAEIGAHIEGVIASGAWTPRRERLPFWTAPVPQVARPKT